MGGKGVSIIIPVYNEEKGLAVMLDELKASVKDWPFKPEIIVVDDGSDDNTSLVAEKRKVKVIKHPRNFGYGMAIKTGILAANHNYLVTIDGDNSYSVEDIPKLVAELDKYHLVLGTRSGKHYWDRFFKYPMRFIYSSLVRYVTGERVPDANTGLRAFRRDIALRFLGRLCTGFSFSTTMTLVFMLNTYFVGFVPVDYKGRIGKSKIRLVHDTLRTSQILTSAIMLYNPIKVFLPISLLAFLFGLGFLIRYIILPEKIILLIGVLLILASLLFFAFGLLADLISQLRKK